MWRATVRGVVARKVRLLLTALSVVLGVTFVCGTYVLTDTLKHSFDSVFAQFASGSDLVVRTRAPFGGSEGSRERLPAALVAQVRQVPGVAAADGFITGTAKFVAKDGGSAIQVGGAPTIGVSWAGNEVGPVRVAAGRAPARDGEVAMDVATARRNGFAVGDDVRVQLEGPAQDFRLVGLFRIGNRDDFGAVSIAAFDPKTAQRVFDAPGLVDAVNVRLQPGARPAVVRRAIEARLGAAFDVSSSALVAAETGKPVDEALGYLNDALLAFAGVGLLVGGFIIFNTFTILVTQRTRELGLLRAMGATGGQVVGSVLAEAAVIGVIASTVGFALGIGLASFLLWLLPEVGFPVPQGPLVVLSRTVVASGVVGVGVTMAAAVYPAIRAARTPPIAAIAGLATISPTRSLVGRAVIGTLVSALGIAIGVYGIWGGLETNQSVAVAFLGGFVVFLGLVAFGPLYARPLSAAIGRPFSSLFGVTGTLARGNAMRNPRRTAATAAALIVGLGLVALVAIFADSLKTSVRAALGDVRADYIVTASQFSGFSPAVAERARAVPGVETAVSFRWGDAIIGGHGETVHGATPRGIQDVIDLRMVEGGVAGLSRGGILLSDREAEGQQRRVGQRLTVDFPRLGPLALPVVGIYETRRFSGAFPIDFVVSQDLFRQGFGGSQQDTLLYVKAAPGQAAAVGAALTRALARDFPDVTVATPGQYLADREQTVDQFLNVFIALLLLSEVIAILGIVNTLLLSVHERTRELGLLRTVGTSRRQVWGMVCGESVIIAVIGCVLGLAIGLLWGWAVTTALRGQFVDTFSIPSTQLLWFLVVSVVAGIVAALLPAWRAARLDVLEAIAEQ
jgi:putative ABC transport system permease protein